MSDPYEIRSDPILGRHLVATRHIPPGQLLVQQLPYAAVLYDEQVPMRCDYCYREATAGQQLLRCSRSKRARYCSREHQMAAWAAGYKQECMALVACAPRVPTTTVRLAARSLWRHLREQKSGQGDESMTPCSWSSVQALQHHWPSLDDSKKTMYAQMATVTREFALSGLPAVVSGSKAERLPAGSLEDDANCLPGTRDVALLLARFACNNHTICDEELRPVGVGLYPLGALINHSCQPNCMQGFGKQGRIEFRSLVSISPGDPLTISYVELAATRQERREELAAAYYFDISPQHMPPAGDMGHSPAEPSTAHELTLERAGDLLEGSAPSGGDQGEKMCLDGHQTEIKSQQLVSSGLPASPAAPVPLPPGYWLRLRPLPVAEVKFALDLDVEPTLLDPSAGEDLDQCGTEDELEGGSMRGLLRVYRGMGEREQQAPWPCDERDAVLTQLLMWPQPGGGRGNQGHSVVPGGLVVRMLKQPLPASADGREDMSRIVEEEEEEEGDEEGMTDQGPVMSGWGPGDGPARSQTRQRMKRGAPGSGHLESTVSVATVDCWGQWATEAAQQPSSVERSIQGGATPSSVEAAGAGTSQAGGGAVGLVPGVALGALAKRVATAAHIQAAAEKMGALGRNGDALLMLQQALRLVDPPSDLVSGGAVSSGVLRMESRSTASSTSLDDPGFVAVSLGPYHLLRMRLNAALLKVAVDEGDSWPLAMQAARALLPVYTLVYPKVWPNLGLHWATLAKLQLLLGAPSEDALSSARAAVSVLEITHSRIRANGLGGPGMGVMEMMEQSLREAQAEVSRPVGR